MHEPRRIAAAALAFLLAAASAAGCGPRTVALYEKVAGSPSYVRVTESHTRTREVRDGLDTRFIFSATWLSAAWVRAFAEEYSSIYYLDSARSERMIAQWSGESERYARFFVALWVPDDRSNDLDRPGTAWSLRLVRSDEKDFEPVYVRATSLLPEEVSRFFPHSARWFRAYEVAFPKEAESPPEPPKEGTPRLKLVLAGVQGRAVLAWR